MKQTSHNASTMGWEFTTVCPVKMLEFSATQASLNGVEKSPEESICVFTYMNVCIVDTNIYRLPVQLTAVIDFILFISKGQVERCSVDVESERLNASQTIMGIDQ